MVKLTRMFPHLALIVGVVLPALPVEGQTEITSGTGTGIESGNTYVTVKGRHSPGLPLGGCPTYATVCDVIADSPAGGNDDVFPVQGAGQITLGPVTIAPGGGSCTYEDLGPPRFRLRLGNLGNPAFTFILEYKQGEYVLPPPDNCDDGTCDLFTRFTLHSTLVLDGCVPFIPLNIFQAATWRSYGPRSSPHDFLKIP